MTAAFAGAPRDTFAAPQRNAAAIGFSATTMIAAATRYDGEIGSGTDNHALNGGMRFTW
jgi:hypothetical protein